MAGDGRVIRDFGTRRGGIVVNYCWQSKARAEHVAEDYFMGDCGIMQESAFWLQRNIYQCTQSFTVMALGLAIVASQRQSNITQRTERSK